MHYFDTRRVPKHAFTALLVILLILGFTAIVGVFSYVTGGKLTCKTFFSQKLAQEQFNKDPERYKKLDGYDHDGKVCESLPTH